MNKLLYFSILISVLCIFSPKQTFAVQRINNIEIGDRIKEKKKNRIVTFIKDLWKYHKKNDCNSNKIYLALGIFCVFLLRIILRVLMLAFSISLGYFLFAIISEILLFTFMFFVIRKLIKNYSKKEGGKLSKRFMNKLAASFSAIPLLRYVLLLFR